MEPPTETKPFVFTFADVTVREREFAIVKAGQVHPVEPKAFRVLLVLLRNPNKLIAKEELLTRVWGDTAVTENSLARNIALLRRLLGDDAREPRFIETVSGIGYRFLCPTEASEEATGNFGVSQHQDRLPTNGHSEPGESAASVAPVRSPEQAVSSPGKRNAANPAAGKLWRLAGILGGLALLIMAAVALLRMLSILRQRSSTASEITPLVSMPGQQESPAISPDGSQVAFSYSGVHPGIYIALIGGEKPLQLTQSDQDDNPVWSPDGRQIAFARLSDNGYRKTLYVIPALGGSERRLYTTLAPQWAQCNQMSWSPDGKSLIFPESLDNDGKARLSLLSLTDLTARPLTSPHNQQYDCSPVFSPDGATIAFARGPMGGFLSDLFVLRVAGGQPFRLTSGNSGGDCAWTQDGKEIVFYSSARGFQGLWRIPAAGGTPQPIAASGYATEPSIAHMGNQLAYEVTKRWDTIWRLDLKDERHPLGPPVRLLSGRGVIWKPSYSPDGKKIGFESDRMGYEDIWICDSDGSNCSQVTDRHGTTATARWSPDGRYLAFESITQDYYQVGVLALPYGTPRMLTTFPDTNNGAPNWSRDGKSIYFYSGHDGGAYQLWKMPFAGGAPVRVTANGGVYGIESQDGRFLYYAKFVGCGVWRRSLETGEESSLPIHVCNWYEWAVGRSGIYFLNPDFPPNGRIEFFDFAHGQSTPVFALDKPVSGFGGLALSPDGKSLLFGQNELAENYIMVMKHFH